MSCGQATATTLKAKLARCNAACDAVSTQLEAKVATERELRQALAQSSEAVSDLEHQIQTAQGKRHELESSLEQLRRSVTSFKSQQSALQSEVHETQVRAAVACVLQPLHARTGCSHMQHVSRGRCRLMCRCLRNEPGR